MNAEQRGGRREQRTAQNCLDGRDVTDDQEGLLEVAATLSEDKLEVVVRDEGPGIGPRRDSPGLGLGLPLIVSLTESVQLGRADDDCTEVRMVFPLSLART